MDTLKRYLFPKLATGLACPRSSFVLVSLTCGILMLLGPASGADGTTGATPLAKPPLWNVTRRQARPFVGRFKLAAPHGRQLINAAYAAEINEYGYLEGSLVVYTYDRSGRETDWIARTYEYHPKGPGRMAVDVIGPAIQNVLGRLYLRVGHHGRLTGILEPLQSTFLPTRTQRITLRRVR
jgi:hypothetical protein